MKQLNEPILEDDYPVYPGYLYVADGTVVQSPIDGDVRRLKFCVGAKEIKRCDITARQEMQE